MDGYDIIIADDHKLFRKGLIELVNSLKEIKSVREAGDGIDLIKAIKEKQPHLVILDLELPNMDGFEAAKIIVKDYPKVKILVLTMYDNTDFVNYLWEIGVHGYLIKNSRMEEMYSAILGVLENDFYKNEIVNEALEKRRKNDKMSGSPLEPIHLTSREKDILKYLFEEKTSKEIGDLMGLSNRTVEKIRNNLMNRYNRKTVVGLVKFAIKNKLIYV